MLRQALLDCRVFVAVLFVCCVAQLRALFVLDYFDRLDRPESPVRPDRPDRPDRPEHQKHQHFLLEFQLVILLEIQ